MKKSTWFYLGPLIILLLLMLGFSVWVFFLKKPIPGVDCRKRSDWVWDKSCKFFEEKFFDSSLKDPSDLQLYLVKFSRVSNVDMQPLCYPMWYCFRYVNVKTGGYSNFSKWTASAVKANSNTLPCLDGVGKCDPNKVEQGTNSCRFNQPLIGIPDLQYSPTKRRPDGSFIYANIHRYTGKLDTKEPPEKPSNENTEIIGYLIPTSVSGVKYAWTDVLFSPCKSKDRFCGRCPGC